MQIFSRCFFIIFNLQYCLYLSQFFTVVLNFYQLYWSIQNSKSNLVKEILTKQQRSLAENSCVASHFSVPLHRLVKSLPFSLSPPQSCFVKSLLHTYSIPCHRELEQLPPNHLGFFKEYQIYIFTQLLFSLMVTSFSSQIF